MTPLRLATRSSPLALWQAHHVATLLHPRAVALVPVETHGDRDRVTALAAMGGFGAFTKAIQDALLAGQADLAVHSLKDLPTIPTPGVMLAAVPARGPAGDAFVSHKWYCFDALPRGATIGTSSIRRRAMLANCRPDLTLIDLRGNVETRLRKLAEQNLDAIVLAEAGLDRLGLRSEIREVLDPEWMLPAVGQGAIAVECRKDDRETRAAVVLLTDYPTLQRVTAERAMLAALGGGCLVPIGATSSFRDNSLTIRGMVLSPDGRRKVSATHRGPGDAPLALGQELAAMLLAEGAGELLSVK
jgi:hydroxymethylbilane synthase